MGKLKDIGLLKDFLAAQLGLNGYDILTSAAASPENVIYIGFEVMEDCVISWDCGNPGGDASVADAEYAKGREPLIGEGFNLVVTSGKVRAFRAL